MDREPQKAGRARERDQRFTEPSVETLRRRMTTVNEPVPQADVPAPLPFATRSLPADLFAQLDAIGMSDGNRIVYIRCLFEAREGFIAKADVPKRGGADKAESLERRGFLQPCWRSVDGVDVAGYELPLLTRGVLR